MSQIETGNTYNITVQYSREQLETGAKWSGNIAIPNIGDRVVVRINNLGVGTVQAYFIEQGWLGVYVRLDNPPSWWVKQVEQSNKGFGRLPGCTMVFGAEVAEDNAGRDL